MYTNILIEKLKRHSASSNNIAIIDVKNDERVTYQSLIAKIKVFSSALKSKGLNNGDKVFILHPISIDLIAFILACTTLNIVPVLADPAMGREVLIGRIKFIEPKFIVIPNSVIKLLDLNLFRIARYFLKFELPNIDLLDRQKFISLKELYASSDEDFSNIEFDIMIENEADFLIVFTSGTTSTPKAVVHSPSSINSILERTAKIIPSSVNRIYAEQPYIMFPSLYVGKTSVINSSIKVINEPDLLRILRKYKINAFFTNPFQMNKLFNYIVSHSAKYPEHLRNIYLGSAPVKKSFLKKLKEYDPKVKLFGVYGMTEALPVAIYEADEKIKDSSELDLLGKFVKGIDYRIDNGELVLKGDIFKKYIGEKNVKEVFTGDIVSIVDGNVYMKSRKKDMIIVDKYNIYPSLYENTINKIDYIKESAMVGIYFESIQDEKVVLFVVTDNYKGQNLKNELLNKLSSGKYSIDKYALPEYIFEIKNIPVKGRSNKVDKIKLREIAMKKIHP